MNTFTAQVLVRTNPRSAELVACGLLAVTPREVFFQWAERKVSMAEGLATELGKGYITQRFKMLDQGIRSAHQQRLAAGPLFDSKSVLSPDYFDYLKTYNDGPVRFGEVKPYAGELDQETFERLFHEVIFDEPVAETTAVVSVYKQLSVRLKRPALQERADVHYALPKQHIPQHLTNANVMLTSLNGHLLTAQPFEQSNRVDTLRKTVYEYGSLQRALELLAHRLGTSALPLQLVTEDHVPEGDLAELIKEIRLYMPQLFSVVTVPQFMEQLDRIEKDASYRKVSSALVGEP